MDPPAGKSGEDDLLVRSVRVLEALAGMEHPATLPSIVERTRLPQTQVYRVLRALVRQGWVDHTPRHGYRLGARGLSLGTLLSAHPELRELARPVLVRLARRTGTTVSFHLRSGQDRVLTLAAAPPRAAEPAGPIALGERAPLVRGCSGRAILAHLPAAEVDGLSVPLLAPESTLPLGSLSLSGDADRFPEATLRGLAGPLHRAAEELAPRLAAVVGPDASSRQRPLDV